MNTATQKAPSPTGNIEECLAQMTADATEIERRLLAAPLSLTGEAEPSLYEIVQRTKKDLERIKKDLEQAKKVWSA